VFFLFAHLVKNYCVLNVSLLVQHYSELPDIKRVIVNTHAIEPQVYVLLCLYLLVCGVFKLPTDYVFFTVTCRIFRHSVTRMGFGMYEGPFVGQSKRQSSDNCAGTHRCLV
jgi:hypothetical protein